MSIFLLFGSVEVLFEGAFSLWVSLIDYLFGDLGSIRQRHMVRYKVIRQRWAIIFKPSKTELASCSNSLFIFKPLTSQEKILLGNPKHIKAFHKSLHLPIDSVIFVFKKYSFLWKISQGATVWKILDGVRTINWK